MDKESTSADSLIVVVLFPLADPNRRGLGEDGSSAEIWDRESAIGIGEKEGIEPSYGKAVSVTDFRMLYFPVYNAGRPRPP